MTLAKATAPLAAAIHGTTGGYTTVLAAVTACCALAALAIAAAPRRPNGDPPLALREPVETGRR